RIEVVGGRHPVLGKAMAGRFVPNDVLLDDDQHRMLIITGPNMAGKSTYLRQVALLVLMAQAGSFIPAERAVIGAVDRIFSRIGAGDDLFSGQSTFMVEMQEVANILHHAGPRSLVILDEVGRGTSTFDGMSVARSVIRYLHDPDQCGARTLFATHYHELTDLDRELEGVRNFSFAVREMGEEIVFLHRLVTGAADHSLGVQVARLAGLPRAVVEEAARYLAELEAGKGAAAAVAGGEAAATLEPGPESGGSPALRTAQVDTVMVELAALDPERLTPLEALALLFRWKKRAGRFGDQGGS
ncbi:MAG: DNA mismatch repair protein MutS, partial [Firmicutes bacterium]|nr:DNA mismatch repair protein MutS [Bacillota bacterium]